MGCHPWQPPFWPSLRDVKNACDDFLWPAIRGGHPAGRRYATLKIVPGNFFWAIKNRRLGRFFKS